MQKKDSGKPGYVFPIMMIMFVAILILFSWRMRIVSSAKVQVEDALTDATLAAAVVDIDTWGATYDLQNFDYPDMFNKFSRTLKSSLNLNDAYEPNDNLYLASEVTVDEFWIYNVVMDESGALSKVILCKYYTNGVLTNVSTTYTSGLDSVKTPNGATVETLTIYAKISFEVMGMPGMTVRVSKGQSVDIVSDVNTNLGVTEPETEESVEESESETDDETLSGLSETEEIPVFDGFEENAEEDAEYEYIEDLEAA